MSQLAQELRKEALEAIKEFCPEPLIYRRFHKGEYDPETRQAVDEQPPELIPIYANTNEFSYRDLGTALGGGNTIEMGDILLSVPAIQLGFSPALGDELDFDGLTWVVKGKRAKRVGLSVIMWELQVRHG